VTEPKPRPWRLLICTNYRPAAAKPSCRARGSERIAELIAAEVQDQGVGVAIEHINCLGQCEHGPSLRLAPGGEFFLGVTPEDVPGVIDAVRAAVDGSRRENDGQQSGQGPADDAPGT